METGFAALYLSDGWLGYQRGDQTLATKMRTVVLNMHLVWTLRFFCLFSQIASVCNDAKGHGKG